MPAQAARLGTDQATLVDTPVDALPSTLIPLALLQSVLDHPQNDRSLRAVASGASPASADARLDLVEPLLARSGFRGALQSAVARARASTPGPGSGPTRSSLHITCVPDFATTAAILDECMDAAWSAAFQGADDDPVDEEGDHGEADDDEGQDAEEAPAVESLFVGGGGVGVVGHGYGLHVGATAWSRISGSRIWIT